jgi:hypothetical protein
MQNADQGKEPPGSGEISFHFSVQPFQQHFRRFIMHPAPGHIDGFNLRSCRFANRLIIGIADGKIIADRTAEPAKAKDQGFQQGAIFARYFERQPPVLHRQPQMIRAFMPGRGRAQGFECILLDQIEDGDASLLLNIGIAPQDRGVIKGDIGDAWVCHSRRASRKCSMMGQGVR